MSDQALESTVAFLGPVGTYSHAAALALFPQGAQWLPVAEIEEVFAAVEERRAQWGVVPVENSSEGSVLATLDGFIQSQLQIAAELMLRINHCLIASQATINNGVANSGVANSGIRRIASHPQSLGQCRQWLKQHFPNIELLPVSSNAEAARLASTTPGLAAIAGKTAAQLYGLGVVHEGIEDSKDNTTRFLLIGNQVDSYPTGKDKTSIIIFAHNEPGTLFRALEPFHRFGISLIKLESRPSRKAAWSYFFYVDLEGHKDDKAVRQALEELEQLVIEVKVLGSYPAAVAR